ncbi:CMBL [Cervus elaphus hippelaphus]|uniref:Carboxymethylenebutenolidase homolog n=1 Tax=Cervus elaphus hippelaphus TaxID=46360 RepID=A0A212C8I9_CEREH|nr:CMBL [Cervus elaphus hippelaphus]
MANEAHPCPCDIGHRIEYGGLGHEVQVEHVKAYLTKCPVDAGKAVVVIQDIFGWQLPNTRYMADMIAGNGYTTIVPDFFVGQEPWHPSGDWSTFPEWLKTRNARKIDKIGVVGFCWGIIKDAEDVYSLKNPTLFIFAENDSVIPLEQVSLLTQKLKEHCKVEYQIKTFSGQTHGFVHRKREDCSPEDKPYIDEARRNLLEWLSKYV